LTVVKKVAPISRVLEVPLLSFTRGPKILTTPLDRAGPFSCSVFSYLFRSPPSLLSNGYPGLFPRG